VSCERLGQCSSNTQHNQYGSIKTRTHLIKCGSEVLPPIVVHQGPQSLSSAGALLILLMPPFGEAGGSLFLCPVDT
jgi:hypothetical protein